MARRKARRNSRQDPNGRPAHKARGQWFSSFAQETSRLAGRPATFLLAVMVIVVWGITGPMFGFSDTWQLIINTGTTIVTFLMVFLIQNTQNRDTLALQLKLGEVILAMKGVPNKYAVIEDFTDEELEKIHEESRKQAEQALEHLEHRKASKAKAKT